MQTLTPPATDPTARAAEIAREQLLAQLAAGNLTAFEQLMRTHNRRLFRVARSILHSDGDAEDAVQEAYLRAFVALKSYQGTAQLSTWLTRIVIGNAGLRPRHLLQLSRGIDTGVRRSKRRHHAALKKGASRPLPTAWKSGRDEKVMSAQFARKQGLQAQANRPQRSLPGLQ